jgi:hypothetical protein
MTAATGVSVVAAARGAAATSRTTQIPAPDLVLILAVMVAGSVAAQLVAPAFWMLTALVAGALFSASVRAARRAAGPPAQPLPPRLERSVGEAFATLPAGEARQLLGEVVRRARSLLAMFAGQIDEQRLTRDVTDLVDACCDIALEHARLDAMLPAVWEPALAPAAARGAADDAGSDELRRRTKASRELLTRRLRDAVAAMDAMLVQQGMERGGSAAERVAELTTELTAEAAARRKASEDIQRLLSR